MPVLVVELGAADAPLRLSLRPSQLSTPLCKAIWGDDVFELDRVLTATPEALTRLVDVGLPNPPVPPVMFAAWADRPLIVERLVRHYKANVNACDAEGRCALLKCAALGNVPMIRLLVEELGCTVNVADDYGFTPLTLAASYRHPAAQRVLAQYWSPKHIPASKGFVVVANSLRLRLLTAELCLRRFGVTHDVRLLVLRHVMAVETF